MPGVPFRRAHSSAADAQHSCARRGPRPCTRCSLLPILGDQACPRIRDGSRWVRCLQHCAVESQAQYFDDLRLSIAIPGHERLHLQELEQPQSVRAGESSLSGPKCASTTHAPTRAIRAPRRLPSVDNRRQLGRPGLPKSSVTTVSMPLKALRTAIMAAVTAAMTNMDIPRNQVRHAPVWTDGSTRSARRAESGGSQQRCPYFFQRLVDGSRNNPGCRRGRNSIRERCAPAFPILPPKVFAHPPAFLPHSCQRDLLVRHGHEAQVDPGQIPGREPCALGSRR